MTGIRPGVRWLLRLALRRKHLTRADVEREIAFHLDARTAQLVARGMDPIAARAEALRRFGDVDQARAQLTSAALEQESRLATREHLENLMDDLRYVFRALARSRGFSVAVILTLGLGIGATTAMFSIIDRLLLRGPEHVVAPHELQRLYITTTNAAGTTRTHPGWGYVTYALLRDHARVFDGIAAYSDVNRTVGIGEKAERIEGYLVTRDFFSLLGVRPALGRFFTDEEDRPPLGQNVVVLGHALWQGRFGGDSAIIGTTLPIEGQPFRVVGVAPPGFTGAELRPAELWLPMSLSRARPDWPTTWRAQWLKIVARIKPGVTAGTAAAEASRLFKQNYGGSDADVRSATLAFHPISFTDRGREPAEASVSRWLTGVTVVVLLIACANVTNLLLARAARRRREVAVRIALGVSGWRLTRLLMSEAVLLALAGCAVGLLFAHSGGQVIRTLLLPEVAWAHSPVSGRVPGFAIALALLTGIVVGLLPALQAHRVDLNAALKSGSPQAGTSRTRARTLLVLSQAMFSFVLLVGAGLFIRSLHRVTNLDLGFEPGRVLSATLAWTPARRTRAEAEAELARHRVVHESIVQRLRATPGVGNATIAVGTPFGNAFGVDLWVPGWDSIPDLGGGGPFISAVSGGYFETTGMRLLRGRTFTTADGAASERVAIVNEPMARALWPNENPLDKCLQIFSKELPCARVIGVVAEARRFALRERPAMQYYVPFGQEVGFGGSEILVRPLGGDPTRFVATMQRLILETDPGLLSVRIAGMQDAINPLTRSWRLGATLFTIFGVLALVIAAAGLYSVIAYIAAQRAQEFGVRMTLGARAADILWLVLRRGMATVVVGVAMGLVIALLAGRFVASLLFETSPHDGLVMTAAAVVLFGVAMLACWFPARRASRVDAAVALRTE